MTDTPEIKAVLRRATDRVLLPLGYTRVPRIRRLVWSRPMSETPAAEYHVGWNIAAANRYGKRLTFEFDYIATGPFPLPVRFVTLLTTDELSEVVRLNELRASWVGSSHAMVPAVWEYDLWWYYDEIKDVEESAAWVLERFDVLFERYKERLSKILAGTYRPDARE